MIPLVTGMAVLFSGIYSPALSLTVPSLSVTGGSQETIEQLPDSLADIINPKKAVEAQVRAYFKDSPILIRIAFCESTFRHYEKDGSVLRGVKNKRDVGVMQINEFYHASKADELKLDLENITDNMAYAQYLYDKKGTQPWAASRPCWGKDLAAR